MKNIVLCCDGTANEFAPDRTNVVKPYSILTHGEHQTATYRPGLGTMEPAGALTPLARRITRLLGRAFGYGLESDVRDAYLFVMRHYQPGDRLFLFGFSRGAYTVRAVASLLKMYGLLRPGDEALVPYAIRLLIGVNRLRERKSEDPFRLAREFRKTFSREDVPIHFVGVWDTVSSVGWIGNPLRLPYTADNPAIAVARHAVAIDERRAFFRTNLWASGPQGPPSGMRDVEQVWFAGVHADIGGGYPEPESGLSKLSLEWMVDQATQFGLSIERTKYDEVMGRSGEGTHAAASPKALLHQSLRGPWWIAEFLPKKRVRTGGWGINLGQRRKFPSKSLIHWSVYERGGYEAELPEDAVCYGPRTRIQGVS